MSLGIHKENGQKRAIKKIPRSKIQNWERFMTEVKILQTLVSHPSSLSAREACSDKKNNGVQDHPNVIKLYEYFEDADNVYLVTE